MPESAAPIARAPNGSLYTVSGGSEGTARELIRDAYWNGVNSSDPRKGNTAEKTAYWTELAESVALAYCRSRGYTRVTQFALGALPANFLASATNDQTQEGWGYADFSNPSANNYSGRAYQFVRWSATCQKTVRRTRR